MKQIKVVQATATDQQTTMAAANKIEVMLKSFIGRYPESAEALEATYQLGLMFGSLMEPEKAIDYLQDIVQNGPVGDQRVGYSLFYIAESYKNLEEYDKAREHYQSYIEEYGSGNPRMYSAATASLNDLETLKKLTIGKEPIPINVKDLNGKTISTAKLKGKVILIDFWATWCAPCRVEMPNVIKLYKKYNSKGFEIVGISLDKDRKSLDKYLATYNMVWPQYFDGNGWQNSVASQYKVRSIPATYLVDRKGKIRYKSVRGKQLEEAVKKLLSET
jgi:thiol-disulfide isomerase/thioredoxin